MSKNKETELNILKEFASDTVDALTKIAIFASKELERKSGITTDSVAPNSFTGQSAISNLNNQINAVQKGLQNLTQEPALARVVVKDEDIQSRYEARQLIL